MSDVNIVSGKSVNSAQIALREIPAPARQQAQEKLSIVIVGHVDHGKSTLIGRLLFETEQVSAEKIAAVKALCKQQNRSFEYAYFLDALEEEQIQNITIDTASINFSTTKRTVCIIDAPGHREFLKNMISGAASADAAVLIVDVYEGVREQTKRHANVLVHLGIRNILVVLNKMDKVAYSQQRYEQVRDDIINYLTSINVDVLNVLPISARQGEQVTTRSQKLVWYNGPAFLEMIDKIPLRNNKENMVLRMPVQDVMRVDGNRVYAGTIASGSICLKDKIRIEPSGRTVHVKQLYRANTRVNSVSEGDAVGVVFATPIFADRGDVIVAAHEQQKAASTLVASVFWFHKAPLQVADKLLLKLATASVTVTVSAIENRLDSETLTVVEEKSFLIAEGETAELSFELEHPVFADEYAYHYETGRFILQRGETICGGGIIKAIASAAKAQGSTTNYRSVESKKRSLVKALSWRILGAGATGIIAWFITGALDFGLKIGALDFVVKIVIYYGHERIWDRVNFGRLNSVN